MNDVTNKPKLTFMGACRDFFGMFPGQTAMQFGAEVKKLTPEDRAEITEDLTALGYNIVTGTV